MAEQIDFSSIKLVETVINDEIRDKCRQLCSEFIAGPWKDLKLDEITVTPIEDGLSNRIYACTNLKLTSSKQSELTANIPAKVVVRLHGSSFVGDQGDMIVVSMDALPLIGEKLYQKGFAPKIYGVFKEGRIEHFIEGIKFPPATWHNTEIIDCIIRKMAEIHQLEMPISKDSCSVLKMAEKFYNLAQENNTFLSPDYYEPEYRSMVQQLLEYDSIGTAKWLRDMAQYIKSPTVFCHNDLHFGNILDRQNSDSLDERIMIIDYDNCSYGFRAYDLAFFFYAKSFIPGRFETWAGQTITTREEKTRMLKVYLDHLIKIRDGDIDPEVDNLENLEREIDFGDILLQFVFKSVGRGKMSPALAPIFQIMSDNIEKQDANVAAAKERCEQYKQSILSGTGKKSNE